MAAKVDTTLTKILSDNEWVSELKKPGMLVVDIFAKFAGPCDPMAGIFKRLKNEVGDIRFIQAQSDTIDVLTNYREKSCPVFAVYAAGSLVNMVRGANGPGIEKAVRECADILKSNGKPPQFANNGSFPAFLAPSVQADSGPVTSNANVSSSDDSLPPLQNGEEYTLALVKPDARQHTDLIRDAIVQNMFNIVREKRFVFTRAQAEEFYQEHADKSFFNDLVSFMISGPVTAFIVSKVGAIQSWRKIIGPANSKRAKEEAPGSLRALYGTDAFRNAVYGSDSTASAQREMKLIMSPDIQPLPSTKKSGRLEKTVAILLPILASNERNVEEIVRSCWLKGWDVSKREKLTISPDQARAILRDFDIDDNDMEAALSYWTSAPSVVMTLHGNDVIEGWKKYAGPVEPSKQDENPDTVNAQWGENIVRPAAYFAANVDVVSRNMDILFPNRSHHGSTASLSHRQGSSGIERTLALVKPDAVQAGIVDVIVKHITEAGFNIVDRKDFQLSVETAKKFYKEHKEKPFFKDLTAFISSAPIVALVLEKENAISAWRELIGPPDPVKAKEVAPNSLRALYGTDNVRNAVYGSDSAISASRAIGVIFNGVSGSSTINIGSTFSESGSKTGSKASLSQLENKEKHEEPQAEPVQETKSAENTPSVNETAKPEEPAAPAQSTNETAQAPTETKPAEVENTTPTEAKQEEPKQEEPAPTAEEKKEDPKQDGPTPTAEDKKEEPKQEGPTPTAEDKKEEPKQEGPTPTAEDKKEEPKQEESAPAAEDKKEDAASQGSSPSKSQSHTGSAKKLASNTKLSSSKPALASNSKLSSSKPALASNTKLSSSKPALASSNKLASSKPVLSGSNAKMSSSKPALNKTTSGSVKPTPPSSKPASRAQSRASVAKAGSATLNKSPSKKSVKNDSQPQIVPSEQQSNSS